MLTYDHLDLFRVFPLEKYTPQKNNWGITFPWRRQSPQIHRTKSTVYLMIRYLVEMGCTLFLLFYRKHCERPWPATSSSNMNQNRMESEHFPQEPLQYSKEIPSVHESFIFSFHFVTHRGHKSDFFKPIGGHKVEKKNNHVLNIFVLDILSFSSRTFSLHFKRLFPPLKMGFLGK